MGGDESGHFHRMRSENSVQGQYGLRCSLVSNGEGRMASSESREHRTMNTDVRGIWVCFEITRAGSRKRRQESQGGDPCSRWECA